MSGASFTIEQILTLLAEAPSHISAYTAGLKATQLHTSPEPAEWSANDALFFIGDEVGFRYAHRQLASGQ